MKRLVFSLVLSGALTSAAVAQIWVGAATFGVTVKNTKGAPIQGALVTIAYRDVGFGAGPAPRHTDSSGEANYANISTGTWSLKIDHPDHLSYLATVVVRKGKKPQFLAEFLEATGAGRQTMRVKPLKGVSVERGIPIEPVRTAAASPPMKELAESEAVQSPVPAEALVDEIVTPTESHQRDITAIEPRSTTFPAEETPEETPAVEEEPAELEKLPPTAIPIPQATPDQADLQEVETVPEPNIGATRDEAVVQPTSEPIPDPDPAPSAPLPTPTPRPAARPADQQMAVTPVDAPEPAAEQPSTAPTTLPIPLPTPDPAPTPTIEPTGQQAVTPQPSESEFAAEKPVIPPSRELSSIPDPTPPTHEGSGPPASDRRALRSYRDRSCFECKPGEWSVSSVAPVDSREQAPCPAISEDEIREQMDKLAETYGERLADYSGPLPASQLDLPAAVQSQLSSSSCRLVAIVLPGGARFTGFRFQASDRSGDGDCLGDQECAVGAARWLFNPGIARSKGATVVFSVFRNSDPTQERTASLTAYFVPPGAWIAGL